MWAHLNHVRTVYVGFHRCVHDLTQREQFIEHANEWMVNSPGLPT